MDYYANWFILISIILLLSLIFIIQNNKSSRQAQKSGFDLELLRKERQLTEKDLQLEKMVADAKGIAQDFATKQFEEWKNNELENHRKVIMQVAVERAQGMLATWKFEEEARIRKDAANRSVRNVLGKVTEHLIPFSDAFSQFNPKDARFLGTPIDLIVFDGIEEKQEEITVYFIEVKTGTSALSPRQKKVMEAVNSGRVKWLRISIKDFGENVNCNS